MKVRRFTLLAFDEGGCVLDCYVVAAKLDALGVVPFQQSPAFHSNWPEIGFHFCLARMRTFLPLA